jgi:hypothetical protein
LAVAAFSAGHQDRRFGKEFDASVFDRIVDFLCGRFGAAK